MSFKTPFLCDRRVYDKKGKWKSPNNDLEENIYYFIKTPKTLVTSYDNGREEIKEQMTIVVFGGKPIIAYDKIKLDIGVEYVVADVTYNYAEHNILVKDMLKPRIASMELVIE